MAAGRANYEASVLGPNLEDSESRELDGQHGRESSWGWWAVEAGAHGFPSCVRLHDGTGLPVACEQS